MATMSGAPAAAIRRASQQARNAMQQLDAEALAEMTRIYEDAAENVRAAIWRAGGTGSRVELEQLRALLEQIDAILRGLASGRDGVLADAVQRAAELGVRPLTGEGLAATGRQVQPVLDGAQAARLVDQAVNWVRTQRAADGLVLSDRVWRIDRGAREVLQRTIEQAVVQGWSATKAAQESILRGLTVPAGTEQAQNAPAVARLVTAADVLTDAQAGPLANTLRVMRTEINRAHGEAYMAGATGADGFVGFRFLLSPRHPRPDICDLLARQNLHGLGAGVYPTRETTPWPAHPNTLSFVVAVFAEELTQADTDGKETHMQALARLAPELRAGVLGPTKAGYFDQGLMSQGMVRSTVGAVRARLTRQGRIPA